MTEFIKTVKEYNQTKDSKEKLLLKEVIIYLAVPEERRKEYLVAKGVPQEINNKDELLKWLKEN